MIQQVKQGTYFKNKDALNLLHWQHQASEKLFSLNYSEAQEPRQVSEEHIAWGREFQARIGAPATAADLTPDKSPCRVLRVGYMSPDFRCHVVAKFMTGPVRAHDRSKVHVTCYFTSHPNTQDDVTMYFRQHADQFHDVHALDTAEVLALMAAESIDILVELAGHTQHSRLDVLARRAAPIQVSWLGYPNTTGLTSIDYRLTDAISDDPDTQQLYTETLFRLDHIFLCYEPLKLLFAEVLCLLAFLVQTYEY
jgi:predicted O-linked N-acetylglucosamine transferase (SPINDLY family)